MQQDQEDSLYAEQVSRYLRSHPQFFEQHAYLLTEIFLPSPHGNGTISLTERQQLAQRDKIRVMESKMSQLITYAEQNDKISGHVHQLSVQLLASPGLDGLSSLLAQSMQQIFAVSHSQLLIWQAPSDPSLAQDKLFNPVPSAFQDWVSSLNLPYCGEKPALAEGVVPEHLLSFAFMPIYQDSHKKQACGVLILGTEDAARFKVDMGSVYLQRIGDLVSAAVSTHL
jgi:uncharacterized protein YigA (DUF484 family)